MKTGQLCAWLWKGLCLPGRSGEPSFPANPRTSLGGDGAATVSLGRPVFINSKWFREEKQKAGKQSQIKKFRRAFLKELPLIMKKVNFHHVKWQIHTFLSLNSLTSQIATLQHTWELSYPLERCWV